MVAAVRDARQEEAGAIADLLSRAAFGPTVSRLVAFPRTSPHGDVLVAENGDGAAAGAVCCVSFGATGWIGALGVAPEARRHGLGRALTEAAIARLHAARRRHRPALRHRHGPAALRAPGLRDRGRGHRVARHRRRDSHRRADPPPARGRPRGRQRARPRGHGRGPLEPPRRAAPAGRRGRGPLGHARRLGGQGALWRGHRHLRRRRRGRRRADGRRRERPRPRDARDPRRQRRGRWPTCAAGASAPPTPASACASGPPVAWRPERQFGLFNLFWG